MYKMRFVLSLFIVVLLNSSMGFGQQKISIEDAIKLSIENNNQLESAVYDVNKAEISFA